MTERNVRTVCNLCGLAGCGMEITVRDGVAVKVLGDKDHPENRGALCPKGHAVLDILYAPDRLTHPMKRVGERGEGKWEPISWEEALSITADRMRAVKQEFGPQAVWFHKGSGHDLCGGDVRPYLHRLANFFGTPNLSCPFYICNGPRSFNMYLTTGSIPAPDVENTGCVVLWGNNPTKSAITRHLKVREALERGAKLIVIDPRRTHFAGRADLHLQLQPGSDGALALGMLKVIIEEGLIDEAFVDRWVMGFDALKQYLATFSMEALEKITWVPQEQIRDAARMYANTSPACIFLGQALDKHLNTSQAIRAITALIAITGNLDARGGNVMLASCAMAKNPVACHEALPAEMRQRRLGGEFPLTNFPYTQFTHPPSAFRAILEGKPYPVKAMFVMAANPMLTSPNSDDVEAALKALDFLVVAETFMTETARYADLVLPACTFLEQTYYATYDSGAYLKPAVPGLLMLRPKVVEPLAESWPDWKIIFELARKLGFVEAFPWSGIEEAIDYELEPTGITVEDLRAHPEGIQIPAPAFLYQKYSGGGFRDRLMIRVLSRTMFKKYPQMYHKYERMGFNTPSKKVEIFSPQLEAQGKDGLPVYHEPAESPLGDPALAQAYPLVLTTGAKLDCYVHSQMRNIPVLRKRMPRNVAEIHPESAAACGVLDGDRIQVETRRGAVCCMACVTKDLIPGVVQMYHGFSDANANLLIDNRILDPITGSAAMSSAQCRIRKA